MVNLVKMALRITTDAFDVEILQYIEDCLDELRMLGVYRDELANDRQITSAVIFYCKAHFGSADAESDRWERMYRNKVTQLMIAKGYGAEGRQEAEHGQE